MRVFPIFSRMEKKIPIFWGCTLTHNYPFLMESTKKVLIRIGIEPQEIEGFGCCPDPVYVKAFGEETHAALSARNLALAEKENRKLLVVCNGCYSVLSEAERKLMNPKERKKMNERLPEGLEYHGEIQVTHILEELHRKLPIIKTLVKRPLKNLRVGLHYGCHILYPPAVEADQAGSPRSMDEIVEALGAESIDYGSKLECCGTPVAMFNREEADSLLKKKLKDLNGRVDCIVTTCPACFMRFDMPPQELKQLTIPVLHLSELIALSMGYTKEELFLECHMTKVDPVLEKVGTIRNTAQIREELEKCGLLEHCGACRKECPASFDPLAVVEKLNDGRYEEVLQGEEIWQCLQCGRCEERCPNNTGLKELFAKLREFSTKEKSMPRIIADKIKMLQETGYGMPQRVGVRKKMGLPAAPEPNPTDIVEIIEKTKSTTTP